MLLIRIVKFEYFVEFQKKILKIDLKISVICGGEDSLLRRDSQDSFVIWVVLLMLTLIVWLFRSVTTAVEYADSEDSEDDDDKSSFE